MKPYFCSLSLLVTLVSSPFANAGDYYVSVSGDDSAVGTLEQPFASIQHAVNLLQAGDICYIRGGVYREVVNLAGKAGEESKPITLTNYRDEKVILDGTEKIDGEWVVDEGKVYKTTVEQDVTQLFVDGKLMTLARFPNALVFSEDAWHRSAARCHKTKESTNLSDGGGHVVDAGTGDKAIANAGISFNGCVALMNFGAHATGSRIVENHEKGSAEFDYHPRLFKHKITDGYFFEGGVGNAERGMLDMAQEWAFDETRKTLYLWAENDGDPNRHEVHGKVRTYALTGDAATQHVVIDGVDFFAATFSFESSDHITLRNCDLNYYAASKRALGVIGPSETARFVGSAEDFCSHITVFNCEFNYSDASALAGQFVEYLLLENNQFYMNDYACVNNDDGEPGGFNPSSTINLDNMLDVTYRRNTLSHNGNAQSFSVNLYIEGKRGKRFNPQEHDPAAVRGTVSEFNFHTHCGLLHTDGSSLYMPLEHAKESVTRYNWFIDNGQRDLRYDGNNKPLSGVHANAYRNVCMSAIRRHSPSDGDGMHIKGDYHETYNNLGVDAKSDINVDLGSGGNAHSITRNNAAQELFDQPLPGISSNNFAGGKKKKRIQEMVRDAVNWDFRPREDAVELIDQGTPVVCSVRGKEIDVTAGFHGKDPDIGAYEFGDDQYWIPGRQEEIASMPVPKDDAEKVKLDADLMYLIALDGTKATVHLGTARDDLKPVATLDVGKNIVKPNGEHALQPGKTYFWRVDCEMADRSVSEGKIWSFHTAASE
ncbi:MAG: hypothetical protein ABJQ29_08850 [Luteolibacter sp.]